MFKQQLRPVGKIFIGFKLVKQFGVGAVHDQSVHLPGVQGIHHSKDGGIENCFHFAAHQLPHPGEGLLGVFPVKGFRHREGVVLGVRNGFRRILFGDINIDHRGDLNLFRNRIHGFPDFRDGIGGNDAADNGNYRKNTADHPVGISRLLLPFSLPTKQQHAAEQSNQHKQPQNDQ